MKELKNTQRAIVKLGYDGRVYKTYMGPLARERYDNEVRILRYLAENGCNFVPKLLSRDPQDLSIVMSYCGKQSNQLSETKVKSIFDELESFGVKHDDPFERNITYDEKEGRFCVIDFEFAELVTYGMGLPVDVEDHRVVARKPKIQWASNNISTRRHDSYIAINLSLEQFNYVGSNGSVSMDEGDFVFALSGVQDCSIELLVKEAVSDGIRQVLRNRFELASAGIIAGGRDLVHDVYRVMCEKLCTYQKHYKDFDHIDSSLSLCWFTPFAVYYFHLGEGAIYHQQKVGEIKKLTKESTVEGKVPQSVYGLTVDTGVIEYAENDRFVIVSKELNSNLSEEELLSALCKGCNDIESSLDSLCENNIQNQLASAILIDIMPFV